MAETSTVDREEEWRALAVIRCGDNSLHRTWAGEGAKFDTAISYFGSDDTRQFPEANYVHRFKGGKWNGIFDFFERHPDLLNEYDVFWFPDDDIRATTDDVNALIRLGKAEQLEIFQPALDDQSYYSHLITLRHPSFRLRYTNFVEIMVPFVSRRLLKETLVKLKDSRSGFGMDFIWPELATQMNGTRFSAAIVDAVSVRHTRPVGGSLHQMMKRSGGPSTLDELNTNLAVLEGRRHSIINGVAVPRIDILAGETIGGSRVRGLRLAAIVASDLLRQKNAVQNIGFKATLRHAAKCAVVTDDLK